MSARRDEGVGIASLFSEIEAETRRQAAAYEEEIRGLLAHMDYTGAAVVQKKIERLSLNKEVVSARARLPWGATERPRR